MKTNANLHNFSPKNSGTKNSEILNKLLEKYDNIEITESGEYPLSDTILMSSNQSLTFGEGVFIRREESGKQTGYVIANKGAYTRTYDENISIIGLKLICGGVQSSVPGPENRTVIPGLRGHLSFFYIKNLTIKDFTALDLPPRDFGIHICTFENVLIENVKIEGRKDAVHFGRGKNFVVRNGFFKTFDDPIALNAHDYASSNPQLGWIENGVIENCFDYNDTDTTGFFCRILAGSWCDWQKGMNIQNSDTVIHNNKMYRALMQPDGKIFTSETPPCHESGMRTIDGINWVFVQNEVCYNCGCKNITFRNIKIEKERPIAFSVHFDNDNFSRSVYPGSEAPVQENITFENIDISGNVPVFLYAVTPLENVKIINSRLNGASVNLDALETVNNYPAANFSFKNTQTPQINSSDKRDFKIS